MYRRSNRDSEILFNKVDWFSVERSQNEAMINEITSYNADKLLNTTNDALVGYFIQKYTMSVPILNRDAMIADQKEIDIDISQDPMRMVLDRSQPTYIKGTMIELDVPFSGDGEFFYIQPTTYTLSPPRGQVSANKLILNFQGTNLSPETLKANIDTALNSIDGYLNSLRTNAADFNSKIGKIETAIIARKEKLLKDRNLVSSLGIALKPREIKGFPYASPEVRRKPLEINQPSVSQKPFEPHPVLPEKEYENILNILERMVRVMECSPGAFTHMGEEDLRTQFLVQLNGQYETSATGETFNYEGKTDILIKDKGRNIFIAECKIWRGEAMHNETIDQLLGYLTWRDTKAAIIIFNRNKNFSDVLSKVQAATASHSNCRGLIRQRSESSWSYKFVHRDDNEREMTVTLMAFDVPTSA